jgi:hypothetical protein
MSFQETAETYARVVARLNADWRVAECGDGIQWLLQRRTRADSPAGARWVAERYHLDRDALLGSIRALCGPVRPVGLEAVAALSARFMRTQAEVPR